MRRFIMISALLLLSACSGGETGGQTGSGASPSEEAALDDAAEMLDQSEADGNVAAPAE
jgi:hypothetical protein